MTDHALYGVLAQYYDAIYATKPYRDESDRLRGILAGHGIEDGARLLDAACGTGGHLTHLQQWFRVTGFDRSRAMLKRARRKAPGVPLFVADLTDFVLGRSFDAAICLFSSIGYVFPEPRLRAAAISFARSLRPGGVLVIEPWLTPEAFRVGLAGMDTYDSDDLKLCRATISTRRGDMSGFEFHWLVAENGASEVKHWVDRHALWLCPRPTLLGILGDAGFDARYLEEGLTPGRGLVVARRR